MHTFRDTATLAVLILLAMTLRVELDGKPAEWSVATPAEAAAAGPPLPSATVIEPVTRHEDVCCAEETVEQTRPVSLPEPGAAEPRSFVWEIDGRRLMIVVEPEKPEPSDPEEEPNPDTCGRTIRAHLSS